MARFDGNALRMTREELYKLPEYSLSLSTGQVKGKMWRRRQYHPDFPWAVGQYVSVDADGADIRWTPVSIEGGGV